jgi:hypothetical protein
LGSEQPVPAEKLVCGFIGYLSFEGLEEAVEIDHGKIFAAVSVDTHTKKVPIVNGRTENGVILGGGYKRWGHAGDAVIAPLQANLGVNHFCIKIQRHPPRQKACSGGGGKMCLRSRRSGLCFPLPPSPCWFHDPFYFFFLSFFSLLLPLRLISCLPLGHL